MTELKTDARLLKTAVSGSVLMNILEDDYELNVEFHKEAREMIFSFAVAHYGEKLTLEEWLLKHYR
jgi:hypothetical protein